MSILPDDPPASARAPLAPDRMPEGLCCPSCRGPLAWGEGAGRCARCGRSATLWIGHFPDFLGGGGDRVEAIAGWPEGALPLISRGLLNLETGRPLAPDERAELEALGLIDLDGRPTGLGFKVAYHSAENHRQAAGDSIAEVVLDRLGLGEESRVLDVGGGAGQTLRLLAPRRPAERLVLDSEPEGLALGDRLCAVGGEDVRFVRASGHALPFADGRFTHVLSRGALNCMHQRTALGEMARVLRPGGSLYCRIEGPGQDLAQVVQAARSGRARLTLRYLRDLALGLGLGLTGRQALPGGRFTGYRIFATAGRVGRVLRRAGCEVTSVEVLFRYGGLPRALEILARKRDEGPR